MYVIQMYYRVHYLLINWPTFQIEERLLYVFCGIGTKVVIIGTDKCSIVFGSDYTINRTGFSLTFLTIDGKWHYANMSMHM